jgi:hypothetical protein
MVIICVNVPAKHHAAEISANFTDVDENLSRETPVRDRFLLDSLLEKRVQLFTCLHNPNPSTVFARELGEGKLGFGQPSSGFDFIADYP